jgi:hypothetical protein
MFRPSSSLKKVLFVLALIAGACLNSRGQEAARPERGLVPNGSFSVSDIENINLLNGNVNLNIPLASFAADRGREALVDGVGSVQQQGLEHHSRSE